MDKVLLIMTLCLIGQATLVPLSAENQLRNEDPPLKNSDTAADIDIKDDKYDVPANPSPTKGQEAGDSDRNQEETFTKNEVKHENENVLLPQEINTQDKLIHQEQQESQEEKQPADMSKEHQEDPQAKELVKEDTGVEEGLKQRPQEDVQAGDDASEQLADRHEGQDGQPDDNQYQVPEKGKPDDNHDARENDPPVELPVEGAQGMPVDQGSVEYQQDDPLRMRPTAEHEDRDEVKEDRQDQQDVNDRQDDDKQAPANEDGNRYDNNQDEYHRSNEEVKPAQGDHQEPQLQQEDQRYLGDRLMEPETEGRAVYMQQPEPKDTEPTPPVQEEAKYNEDEITRMERDFSKELAPEQEVQYQEDSQYQQEPEYQKGDTHAQQETQQHEDHTDGTQNQNDAQNQNDDIQYQEENTQHQEENNQYQDDNRQYQEENNQYQEENNQYQEENNQYQEENIQHQEENTQHQEENNQYQEENNQYQEENNQYKEENNQYQEENNQYQEENTQHQEENNQYQEQNTQHQEDSRQYHSEPTQDQEDFKAEEPNQYQEEDREEQPAENVQYHEEDSPQQKEQPVENIQYHEEDSQQQQQQQQQEPQKDSQSLDEEPKLQEPQEQVVQAETLSSQHMEQQEPLVQHVNKEDTPLPPNPNIVIFLADGISRAAFVEGESLVPNLMRIAEEGVYFSDHLAGGVTDTSSRAALMTGRLAVRYGMALDGEPDIISTLASQSGLPPTETTFASVLQEKGYATALIGKWNLGMSCESLGDLCHHPNNHGFDHYFGMPLVNHYTYANNTPKEDLMKKPLIITAVAILVALVLRRFIGTMAVFIMAVSVLGVFGWTWFCINNSHIWSNAVMRNGAVVEQPADMEQMAERMVKEGVRFLKTAKADNKPFLLVVSSQGQDDQKARLQELDQGVGELLRAVQELGLNSNTLTYFTSTPHVPSANQDEMIREVSQPIVPALLRWPSVLPAGLVVRASTSHLDIMPTLVQVASGTLQGGQVYDGRSLLPRLRGGLDIPPPLFVYCGAAPHVIKHTSTDGKVYVAHLFPPQWSHDAAAPYCKPQSAPTSSRASAEQHDSLTIYELTAGVDGVDERIPSSHPMHHMLLRTFTTLLEQHRYQLEEPVDNQFSWYKQSWHAYLQPKCAATQGFTCTESDNALHEPDF